MIHRITSQFDKRETSWSRMIRLTFILAFLYSISACRASGKPSDEQIDRAKRTVSEIRASLYMPANVELLAEELYHGRERWRPDVMD
jgi:hypothetical protein